MTRLATRGAANVLAGYAARPTLVVTLGRTAEAVLALPMAALRLPPEMVAGLRVVGFRDIGELATKLPAPLTLRFGPELGGSTRRSAASPNRSNRCGCRSRSRSGAPSPSRSAPVLQWWPRTKTQTVRTLVGQCRL